MRSVEALDAMRLRPLLVFVVRSVSREPSCRQRVDYGVGNCGERFERDAQVRDVRDYGESGCDAPRCDFRQHDGRLDLRHGHVRHQQEWSGFRRQVC